MQVPLNVKLNMFIFRCYARGKLKSLEKAQKILGSRNTNLDLKLILFGTKLLSIMKILSDISGDQLHGAASFFRTKLSPISPRNFPF